MKKQLLILVSLMIAFSFILSACGSNQGAKTPEEAINAYYQAIQNENIDRVYDLVSEKSKNDLQITEDVIRNSLQSIYDQYWKMLSFEILSQEEYAEDVVIFTVKIEEQVGENEPKTTEQRMTAYKEGGGWKINWAGYIETQQVKTEAKTENDLTLQPLRYLRFVDFIEVKMFAENKSEQTLVWGELNYRMAGLTIEDETVYALMTNLDYGLPKPVVIYPGGVADEFSVFFSTDLRGTPQQFEVFRWHYLPKDLEEAEVPPEITWGYQFDLN